MNLPTKVCLGAGAFLVMSGGLLALTGFAMGAETHLDLPWGGGSATMVETAVETGTATQAPDAAASLSPFSSVEVDVPVGDVSVAPSGDYGISLGGACAGLISYELDGDTLRVTGEELSSLEYFSSGDEVSVVICVPDGIPLDTIEIHTAMGQVELIDLTVGSLTAASDLGELYLDSVTAADARLTLSTGDLTGYNLTATGSLTVTNDMGDVYLDGDFQGQTDVTLAMGDLELNTYQPLDTYGLELNVALGDLYLDGSTQYGSVHRDGGPNQLKVDSSMGDVNIYFG